MIASSINPAQLRRLQTLYSQFEAHTLDVDRGRDARLAWAAQQIGHTVSSFSALTMDEGKRLIDILQGVLGVKAPNRSPRKRMAARDADNAGTMGRRDQKHDEIVLAGPQDIAAIQAQLDRLGWDQAGLDRFLFSKSSPLRGRTQICTLADANKVRWALKHLTPRHTSSGKDQPIAS